MVLTYQAPHEPLQAPEHFVEKYQYIADKNRRIYAAMVDYLDFSIGRIADALEKRGLDENTLLIFLSDNGGTTRDGGDNTPLRGEKGDLWEGGIRVPAFLTWPNFITPGKSVDQPFHIVDLFPTLLTLAGGRPVLHKSARA